jgi:tetratricopeptide (TPR) repeat protein
MLPLRAVAVAAAIAIVVLPPLSAQTRPGREKALLHYRVGLENLRAEAFDAAAAAFQQAIALDDQFDLAYFGLGRANMGLRRYVEAVSAFARCRDLYRAQAGRQFSNAQEAQRYRRERIEEIDETIRQYQTARQTAQVQYAVRQLSDQKRQLQDALQRGANMSLQTTVPAWISLALGSAYFRAGRLTEAEQEYKAAIAADPGTGEAHNNLAVVYLETGRYDDAENSVKAAEKAGFRVNPQLKQDIKDRRRSS